MGNYGPDKTPYLETFHAVRIFSLGGSEWGKFSWKQANILVFNEYFESGRSSRPEVFCKKGVLRNFVKLTGKHLCQSLFFNKVAGRDSGTSVFL